MKISQGILNGVGGMFIGAGKGLSDNLLKNASLGKATKWLLGSGAATGAALGAGYAGLEAEEAIRGQNSALGRAKQNEADSMAAASQAGSWTGIREGISNLFTLIEDIAAMFGFKLDFSNLRANMQRSIHRKPESSFTEDLGEALSSDPTSLIMPVAGATIAGGTVLAGTAMLGRGKTPTGGINTPTTGGGNTPVGGGTDISEKVKSNLPWQKADAKGPSVIAKAADDIAETADDAAKAATKAATKFKFPGGRVGLIVGGAAAAGAVGFGASKVFAAEETPEDKVGSTDLKGTTFERLTESSIDLAKDLTKDFNAVRATGIGMNGVYEGMINGVSSLGYAVDGVNWAIGKTGLNTSDKPFLGYDFIHDGLTGIYNSYANNVAPSLKAEPQNVAESAIGITGRLTGEFIGAAGIAKGLQIAKQATVTTNHVVTGQMTGDTFKSLQATPGM